MYLETVVKWSYMPASDPWRRSTAECCDRGGPATARLPSPCRRRGSSPLRTDVVLEASLASLATARFQDDPGEYGHGLSLDVESQCSTASPLPRDEGVTSQVRNGESCPDPAGLDPSAGANEPQSPPHRRAARRELRPGPLLAHGFPMHVDGTWRRRTRHRRAAARSRSSVSTSERCPPIETRRLLLAADLPTIKRRGGLYVSRRGPPRGAPPVAVRSVGGAGPTRTTPPSGLHARQHPRRLALGSRCAAGRLPSSTLPGRLDRDHPARSPCSSGPAASGR